MAQPSQLDCASAAGARVHLLPCTVETTGPCPVGRYFETLITDGDLPGSLQTYFRGRKLAGPPRGGRSSRSQSSTALGAAGARARRSLGARTPPSPQALNCSCRSLTWAQSCDARQCSRPATRRQAWPARCGTPLPPLTPSATGECGSSALPAQRAGSSSKADTAVARPGEADRGGDRAPAPRAQEP